jgi:leucyl-tRNA synthetase
VVRRDLEQWFFRITAYADELLEFEGIDWPERIKLMQRNWIGKSFGTEISFELDHPGIEEKEIRVFTTRPDTAFGVTFMVLAPEHPLVAQLTSPDKQAEVDAYITKSRRQSEIERLSTEREKDGVFIGAYVTNRLNGEKVPVWIADYVLLSYGTGAVMAVPAHDERDFAFAKKYKLPIRVVITPPDWDGADLEEAYIEPGTMTNSAQFDKLPGEKGMEAVSEFLEEKGWGKRTVTYKLRDWLISRQRYWGAPIPMIYCQKCGIVPVNTTCPRCSGPARRETDTMDTFMCSSWYFLRYTSPHYEEAAFDDEKVKHWLPVDLYTGGAEHAVMHLFYARFFIKAIRDMGLVDFGEPFTRLFNQGIIIAEKRKMSKSRGNVVNPDDYVAELGADAVRAYLMFIAPWEQGGEWDDSGISGISRWLNRLWGLCLSDYEWNESAGGQVKAERELERLTHQTVRKVTQDLEKLRLNTMIAALMEFTNHLTRVKEEGAVSVNAWKVAVDSLLLLLAPTAPHLAEELWQQTGHEYSIHNQSWPGWNEELAREEEITLVVQVNGKLRDRITVSASVTEDEAKKLALESEKAKPHIEGKEIAQVVYVPGRLVNLVVK